VRLRALIDRLGGKPGERPVVGDRPARDRLERRTVEQKELAVARLTVAIRRCHRSGPARSRRQVRTDHRADRSQWSREDHDIQCLFRAHSATEGRISLNGTVVSGKGPAQRARLGLGRTFQHVELWDSLTVFQNVALAAEAGLSGANVVRQVVGKRGDRNLHNLPRRGRSSSMWPDRGRGHPDGVVADREAAAG